MSYTHDRTSKAEFLAAVEDAQATHGTRWTLGKGQPPPWSIEVDTWGEPCCLVDRASKTSTAYEPDYSWRKPRAPPPKPPAAQAARRHRPVRRPQAQGAGLTWHGVCEKLL